MKRSFTFLIAILCLFTSLRAFSQTCTILAPTVCTAPSATVESFATTAGGFTTTGNIAYIPTSGSNGGNFENPTTAAGTYSATLTSGSYFKTATSPSTVQAGFFLATGNSVTVNSVTLNIIRSSDGAVIATCTQNNPAAGQLCYEIFDVDITTGMLFRYQFVIDFTTTGASGPQSTLSFDNFGYSATSNAPLPVSFTGITALKKGTGVEVTWKVATEQDVIKYEIQRSTNGRDFVKVGLVNATGNSAYTFIDNQPAAGINFYRVKNLDIDGRFKFTNLARINLSKIISLAAYPLPVMDVVNIEHGNALKGLLTISTTTGQVIKTVQIKPEVTLTTINVATLKSGLYVVRFDNGQGSIESLKIVKQ